VTSSVGPRLGPEDTEPRAICGYADDEQAPRCQAPAEIHLWVLMPDGYETMLAACLRHYPIARLVGTVIDRHRHWGVCGLPGTVWSFDLQQCVLDDSGQEPERSAENASPVLTAAHA